MESKQEEVVKDHVAESDRAVEQAPVKIEEAKKIEEENKEAQPTAPTTIPEELKAIKESADKPAEARPAPEERKTENVEPGAKPEPENKNAEVTIYYGVLFIVRQRKKTAVKTLVILWAHQYLLECFLLILLQR